MNTLAHERPDPAMVRDMLLRFLESVMLSRRSAATLLGVSHSSLVRWADGTADPYTWTAEPVIKRIEVLNEANEKTDLYAQLVHLTHPERLEVLKKVLQQHNPNA